MGTGNGQAWVFDTSARIWAKNIRREGPWRISGGLTETQFSRRNSVVKLIAGWETGPPFEAKTANSCKFFHRYITLLCPTSGADCNTAPPGIGKTQSALLCQKFGFQHISLDAVLHEKSDDQTYPHAEFVKDCLREGVDVPRELKVDLLERKVNEGIDEGKKWSVVHGFPKSMQEVHEFEHKVGLVATNQTLLTSSRCKKKNYILLFNCPAQGSVHRIGDEVDDELHIARGIYDFQIQNAEMESHLKTARRYFNEVSSYWNQTKYNWHYVADQREWICGVRSSQSNKDSDRVHSTWRRTDAQVEIQPDWKRRFALTLRNSNGNFNDGFYV